MSLSAGRILAVTLLAFAGSPANAIDVLQFGYGPGHGGNNAAETALAAGNVAQLTQQYVVTFAGTDGAAVFLEHAATGSGTHDLLFVTTIYGVAAIDAATGAPVWTQSTSSVEYSTGAAPAIDPGRQFVYGPGNDGRVHKLAVADGGEVNDGVWPVVSSRKPAIEKSGSPLTFATAADGHTYLYSVTSSFNDKDDYQGHVTAIDLGSGAAQVYNAACSDQHVHFVAHGTPGVDDCANTLNGIWSRAGVTYDSWTDRIYVTTGNGPFDGNAGGHDWGDSVLALRPDGSGGSNGMPLDSYTPAEYETLAMLDADLGSSSPVVLPPVAGSAFAHLGAQIGKDGVLRLLDMDNLGRHGGPGAVGGELQKLSLLPGDFAKSGKPQPAVWPDVHGDGAVWLFVSVEGTLSGLRLAISNGQPLFEQRWLRAGMTVTGTPIVANDVLYTTTEGSNGASIVALDPRAGTVLWTSPPIDHCCHTQNPLVANGRLYLASGSVVTMFAASAAAPPPPADSQPAQPTDKPARLRVRAGPGPQVN